MQFFREVPAPTQAARFISKISGNLQVSDAVVRYGENTIAVGRLCPPSVSARVALRRKLLGM